MITILCIKGKIFANFLEDWSMHKYYDRKTKKYEIEQTPGHRYLKWTYSSPAGMKILELIVKKKLFSKQYGLFCDSRISKRRIKPFVRNFNIDVSICEKNLNQFRSFNDFFTRKLTDQARPINNDLDVLISPGDGKIVAYDNIDLDNLVQIKGYTFSFNKLIDEPKIIEKFAEGTCIILRLGPTDYHRFHFVDNGICGATKRIKGNYYSVNPVALKEVTELFCKNKREWSLFHSDNFGDVLCIEVGATFVGSIIQTYTANKRVEKGSEKGYFKFGGSTCIFFFEKGKVKIDEDIICQTKLGYETSVVLGEQIGKKMQ